MDMTNCIRKGSVIVINLQRNFFSKNQKHKTLQCSGTLLEEFFSAALYIFFPPFRSYVLDLYSVAGGWWVGASSL